MTAVMLLRLSWIFIGRMLVLLLIVITLITRQMILAESSNSNVPIPKKKIMRGENLELSRNITAILNSLVSPAGHAKYDKRLRPNYGGSPVDVGITIHVSSISAVSEVEMDYTLDIYLRQMWTDPRLQFSRDVPGDLTIGVEYMGAIWVPDTFFPNEKKSFFHQATTHNSFLRITSEGEVLTSQRLTVTATCPMELQLFPLDSQECTLEIESYGYSTRDIRYRWHKGKNSVTKGNVKLPQFMTKGHYISENEVNLSTGNYSRLECTFMFTRSIGFYLIQIYLPSQLIVIISWVSFWLSRDATPARVSLGVTTVLTMTTLMTTTNSAMPKVSYIKSIDIYLITCFFLVFATLLEYAAVGYLNKRLRMKKEVKMQRQQVNANTMGAIGSVNFIKSQDPAFLSSSSGLIPGMPSSGSVHRGSQKSPSVGKRTGYLPLYGSMQNSPVKGFHPTHQHPRDVECDCDIEQPDSGAIKAIKLSPAKKRKHIGLNPSSIDKYSRIFFPLIFLVFNAIYWIVYVYIRNTRASEMEALGAE